MNRETSYLWFLSLCCMCIPTPEKNTYKKISNDSTIQSINTTNIHQKVGHNQK